MKTVNSISGGKTSAYIAAHYPSDYNVFSLVRTDDTNCKFKDENIRQIVSDRLGVEFIGTLEEDVIIYTILDLEQYIGKKIHWVTGISFDQVVKTKGGWLPNKLHRYCTTNMKLIPIFEWWQNNFKNSHLPVGIDIICIDNIKLDNADASVRFTAWGQIDYMIDIKSIKGLSFQNNWEMINNIKTYRSKLKGIREYVKNCFPVIAFKITSKEYDSVSKENGSVIIPIKELNI